MLVDGLWYHETMMEERSCGLLVWHHAGGAERAANH